MFNKIANLSVGKRLFMGFGLVLALTAGIGLVGWQLHPYHGRRVRPPVHGQPAVSRASFDRGAGTVGASLRHRQLRRLEHCRPRRIRAEESKWLRQIETI